VIGKEAMKAEEQVAKNYLDGLRVGAVSFEPDGNIPPDFSLGSRSGVEVRKLNQQHFGETVPKGLEELAIPLWKMLAEEIPKFDTHYRGRSYWVGVEFGRPFQESRVETAKALRLSLKDFLRRGGRAPAELAVSDNLKLIICPASPVRPRVFRLGGGMDWDSGGGLIPMYVDNISYCIEEKSQKIAAYADRYEHWWLLLVDFLGWGLDGRDESELRAGIITLGRFDRVIVIGNQYGERRLDLQDEAA
jgi:hypothetical protein